MITTGQTKCAYCGADFTSLFETWLTMALDHVIPLGVCESLRIPYEWREDCSNKVLACAACNSFRTRYEPKKGTKKPKTIVEFFNLRDAVFKERKKMILRRRKDERLFFDDHPWAFIK